MDLVYSDLPPECKIEIEKLGGKIEDASDYIHEERVSIHYSKEKIQEYESILQKFGLLQSSLSYLLRK